MRNAQHQIYKQRGMSRKTTAPTDELEVLSHGGLLNASASRTFSLELSRAAQTNGITHCREKHTEPGET